MSVLGNINIEISDELVQRILEEEIRDYVRKIINGSDGFREESEIIVKRFKRKMDEILDEISKEHRKELEEIIIDKSVEKISKMVTLKLQKELPNQ